MTQRTKTYTYRDLGMNFSAHPVTGDLVCRTDASSVLQSIRNLLGYRTGDVIMAPDIASNINKLLFEINDSLTRYSVEEKIKEVIRLYEPRAELQEVRVEKTANPNAVAIRVRFFILNQEDAIEDVIYVERTR